MFHVVTVSVDYHSRKARTRGGDSPANVARTENHIASAGCGERAAVQARSSGSACTGATIQAVSYTHLDVYKRQVVSLPGRRGAFLAETRRDSGAELRKQLPALETTTVSPELPMFASLLLLGSGDIFNISAAGVGGVIVASSPAL